MEQTEQLTAPKPWKHLAAIAVVTGLIAPTAAVLALNFPLQMIGLLFLVPPAFVIALFAGLHAYARAKGLPLAWRKPEYNHSGPLSGDDWHSWGPGSPWHMRTSRDR
ncbi:hypothetical protein [Sinimarinibacterium flocculans]|uniref:Uncharacterized protein n=1 Tax=Sinimarinibacterium flocculans TaxID=985250 RepID=A0A318E0J0_9GAMM|nr:hypothetical protein [Sinimarinibacterium flocculans]PXV62747.1 hypothetical protein C8D93_1262 [Sinimarinibacterium flocculans]